MSGATETMKSGFNEAEMLAHSWVRELLWVIVSDNQSDDPAEDKVSDERAAMIIDGLKVGGFVITCTKTGAPPVTQAAQEDRSNGR